MSAPQIRLDLARGHWSLGERAEALTCLQRVAEEDRAAPGLVELIDQLLAEAGGAVDDELLSELGALQRELAPPECDPPIEPAASPLTTSTMAELLAEQGHDEQALGVVDAVLRRDPDDERAQAVRERLSPAHGAAMRQIAVLEGWLANLKRAAPREACR